MRGRTTRQAPEICVTEWQSFKKSWKATDFVKDFDTLNEEEKQPFMIDKLKSLLEDKEKACYLFPNSLKQPTRQLLIQLVSSKPFNQELDYEYQNLYLGKPKQLLVHKKISSLILYLQKYRIPTEYKDVINPFIKLLDFLNQLQIQKNVLISEDDEQSQQTLKEVNQRLEQYKKKQVEPQLKKFKKIVEEMLKDFKKQQKKSMIEFRGTKSYLQHIIKEKSTEQELFFAYKYTNISQFDEHKDVVVYKDDPQIDQKQQFYEHESEETSTKQEEQIKPIKIQTFHPPQNIHLVQFKFFKPEGAVCDVNFTNSKKKRTQELIVSSTSELNWKNTIKISEKSQDWEVLLPPFNQGVSQYKIIAKNQQGQSQPYFFKIWNEVDPNSKNQQGMYTINSTNYSLYQLGKSQLGLIPSLEEEQIQSTQGQWKKANLKASQFSLSSHVTICNQEGDVASWGALYYHQQKQQEQEQSLVSINQPNFRIEKPCSILAKENIRKVSCGQYYCLMSDIEGKVWGFGQNSYGQLGLGHLYANIDTSDPILLPQFNKKEAFIVDVTASYFGASFAIDHKGSMYRWGTNQSQATQFPIKDTYNNVINFEYGNQVYKNPYPFIVSKKVLNKSVKSIHPGLEFVLILTEDKEVYGWGKCQFLGQGDLQNSHFRNIYNICNPIPILKEVQEISVGIKHILALKNGSLYGWGDTQYINGKNGFLKKPQVIKENYKGYFHCGPELSVLQKSENQLEVVGDKVNFEKESYVLPEKKMMELKAGPGIVMIKCSQ